MGLRLHKMSQLYGKALKIFQEKVVTPTGFEPVAYRLGICRSILLSYGANRQKRRLLSHDLFMFNPLVHIRWHA